MSIKDIKNLALAKFSRARTKPVTTIVLHSTDGKSAESSVSWLAQIGLSYHYIIERNGDWAKLCPVGRVGFHAGKSVGPDGPEVNRYSIGIAFANHESKGEAITEKQLATAKALIADLVKDSGFPLEWVTMHRTISPGRKTDPAMLQRADLVNIAGPLTVWWGPKP